MLQDLLPIPYRNRAGLYTTTAHISKYREARPELAQAPMATAAGLAKSSLTIAWQVCRNITRSRNPCQAMQSSLGCINIS